MKIKLSKKQIQVLVLVAISIALLFSMVAITLAWYTSQAEVNASDTVVFSASTDYINVNVDEEAHEFNLYMGQTGTAYNGDDSPYYLTYSPISLTLSLVSDEALGDRHLTLKFDERSYIEFASAALQDEMLTNEALYDNFCFRMVLLDAEGNDTETILYSDGGFLRYVDTNEYFNVINKVTYNFKLNIYFQGEYAYNLLNSTHSDIDSKYKFDYSNEKYMFSIFHLYCVFGLSNVNTLNFNTTTGYSYIDNETELESKAFEINVASTSFTGASIYDQYGLSINNVMYYYDGTSITGGKVNITDDMSSLNENEYYYYIGETNEDYTKNVMYDYEGNAITFKITTDLYNTAMQNNSYYLYEGLPTPEVYDSETGNIDTSVYFTDWFYNYTYYDTRLDDTVTEHRKYRASNVNNEENIYTIFETAIFDTNVIFYSSWANSNSFEINYNYQGAGDPITKYLRPRSTHYIYAGYVTYNTSTGALNIYNPSYNPTTGVLYMYVETIPKPARSGYTFLGWASVNNASYSINTGTISNAIFTQANSYTMTYANAVTLYAVWEQTFDITFHTSETWGSNYANITSTLRNNLTSTNITSNSTYTITALARETIYTNISNYVLTNGIATKIADSSTKSLTFSKWQYNNGSSWVYIDSNLSAKPTANIDVYPVWSNRGTYSITLDLHQTWASGLSHIYGTLIVTSPIEVDKHTILFNEQTTIEYNKNVNLSAQASTSNIIVSNIPEGVSVNDMGLVSHIGVSNVSRNAGHDFLYLSTTTNDKGSSGALPRNWSMEQYDTTQGITNNITLYGYYD